MSYQIHQTPEERKSLPNRGLATSTLLWMKEKKERDQRLWEPEAKDLWIVENKVYDLSKFAEKHPGGESWIRLTKGQDITEHFIVHHLNEEKARGVLNKYYVGECKNNVTRMSFEENGFYRTLKKRVMSKFTAEELQDESTSKVYAGLILLSWIIVILMTLKYHSYLLAILSAPLMVGIIGVAHNFVHHKESVFRYLFFLTGFTHRQWQIMHCISHHVYPNTELDYEIAAFQPITFYLRNLPENNIVRVFLLELLFCFLQPLNMILKLVVLPIVKRTTPDILYSFPLIILIACVYTGNSFWDGLKLYMFIYGFFTACLMKVLFCGHRIQDTWTEGSEKIQDYGEHIIYATSDTDTWIKGIWSYILLAGFNIHVAHHFFPTCDHHKLPEVDKEIQKLCLERGIKRNQKSRIQCFQSIYKGMLHRIEFIKK